MTELEGGQHHQKENDSELWGARYRNPFLILGASARSGQLYCEYDIVNVSAPVHAM